MASDLATALHGPLADVLDLLDTNDDPGILRAAVTNIGRRVKAMERRQAPAPNIGVGVDVSVDGAGVPQESDT